MKVELISVTNYANIYGIYDKSGMAVGTVEVVVVGRNCGVYAYSLSARFTRNDIKRIWKREKRLERAEKTDQGGL